MLYYTHKQHRGATMIRARTGTEGRVITDVAIVSTRTGTCTDSLLMAHNRHNPVRDIQTRQMRARTYPHHYLIRTADLWQALNREITMGELTAQDPPSYSDSAMRPVIKRLRHWVETQQSYSQAIAGYSQQDIVWVVELTLPALKRKRDPNALYAPVNYGFESSKNPAQRLNLLIQQQWQRWIKAVAEVRPRRYNQTHKEMMLDTLMRELRQRISSRQYTRLQQQLIDTVGTCLQQTRTVRAADFDAVLKRRLRAQGAVISNTDRRQLALAPLEQSTLEDMLTQLGVNQHWAQKIAQD